MKVVLRGNKRVNCIDLLVIQKLPNIPECHLLAPSLFIYKHIPASYCVCYLFEGISEGLVVQARVSVSQPKSSVATKWGPSRFSSVLKL